ncbi:type III-B CRISPR-associated protein Cas10/Cmr2 [Sulfurisphaera javensis]|uniref:Type III-B CRISPR-associated protein Cas10/Cmr2 n=1 Tax=Sulfurisphaera javensis TaxID=2049879 RepID=A0AAT9GUP4_9CREN
MPNNNDPHEFVLRKILALFHDPPNKAEILSYNFSLKDLNYNSRVKGDYISHEEVAEFIFNRFLSDLSINFGSYGVKYADWLSSSIDRYMFGAIAHESSYTVKEVKLRNIIYPKFIVELKKGDKKKDIMDEACTFIYELKQPFLSLLFKYIINKDYENLMLFYQVLYLIYELLWIDLNYSTGPSDTRVPTHQIFDHLYSSASMINWLPKSKPRSKRRLFMMGLDIVGVADFIGKGRKVRDLWVSSYLVSALIWYILLHFINTYGPDTVIFPSLRFNQFYAFYVYEKLRKTYSTDEGMKNVINRVKDLITKYVFNNDDLFLEDKLGIPPYPIVPGRATLVLPSFEIENERIIRIRKRKKFENEVNARFNEGWKKLVDTIEKLAECKLDEPFWNIVCNVIKNHKDMLTTPPLRLRVKIVEKKTNSKNVIKWWNYYDEMYRELVNEFKKSKLVKVTPESQLRLNSSNYETCTSCGVLPAVISVPRSDQEKSNFMHEWGLTENKNKLENLEKIISPGERLCPVCLVKRAIGVEPRVLRTLLLDEDPEEVVEFIKEHNISVFIPSTSHIASVDLYEKHCVKDKNLDESERVKRISMWRKFNEYKGCAYLDQDPEELWFSEERREEFARLGLTPKSPYYALVRADSDYLGDLLEGKLTPYLAGIIDSDYYGGNMDNKEVIDFLKDYYVSQVSADNERLVEAAIFLVEKVGKCDLEYLARNLRFRSKRNLIGKSRSFKIKDSIEAIKYFKESLEKQRIILTPAFHISISSALNRALLYEIKLVNELGGFVIYAGGDDLLAMFPADKVIDFLKDSRLAFAGRKKDIDSENDSGIHVAGNGFYKIKEAYYPAMAVVGRTYSVVFSRYDDPLQYVIQLSYDLVEKLKERVYINYNNEKRLKDLTFFYFNGDLAVIPNSFQRPIEEVGEIIDVLEKLKKLLDEGELSTRFLYDYIERRELLHSLYSHGNEESIRKYLSYLFSRHSNAKNPLDTVNLNYLISNVVWDDGRTSYVIDELIKALIILKRW